MSDLPFSAEEVARLHKAAADHAEAIARAMEMVPDPAMQEWLVWAPEYHDEGVAIERFVITPEAAMVDKLRAGYNPQRSDRSLDPGTFTRLEVDGVLWMTDTPAEVRDHLIVDEAMARYAGGSVIIVGLGLGMVLNRAIRKRRMKRIDVVELDPRIIRALGPHYQGLAKEHGLELVIHEADIHQWRAEKGQRWDVAWLDIWPTINDDDMPEVRRLSARFQRGRASWVGAWAQDERRAMRRRIKSGRWAY